MQEEKKLVEQYKPQISENGSVTFADPKAGSAFADRLNELAEMKIAIELHHVHISTGENLSLSIDLSVGELVFKRRNKGDSGYDLPSTYANDPDQTDYYHVGVVMSVSPLKIIHCTGVPGGIATDAKLGKWSVHGQLAVLANISQRKEGETLYKVTIKGGNAGKPINLRKTKSTSSAIIDEIPQGTEVDYIGDSGDWTNVVYRGQSGYVLSSFVVKKAEQIFTDEIPFWFTQKLAIIDDHEQAIRAALEEIYERAGRG